MIPVYLTWLKKKPSIGASQIVWASISIEMFSDMQERSIYDQLAKRKTVELIVREVKL